MTYDQFWNGDSCLVKAYRKAFELKQELENQAAWRQGLYVYEAIVDCVPALRPLSKAKRPLPYPTKPYEMKREIDKREREEKELRQMEKNKAKMESFAARWNKMFKDKKNQAEKR